MTISACNLIREVVNSVGRIYQWDGFYGPETHSIVTLNKDSLIIHAVIYASAKDTVSISEIQGQLFYSANFMLADRPERIYFTSPAGFFTYEEGYPCFFKDDHLIIKNGPLAGTYQKQRRPVKFSVQF